MKETISKGHSTISTFNYKYIFSNFHSTPTSYSIIALLLNMKLYLVNEQNSFNTKNKIDKKVK